MASGIQEKFFQLLVTSDREAANLVAEEWAGVHGWEKMITEVLEPALQHFGRMWASAKDVSLAQGYIAGKIAEDIMEKVAATHDKGPAAVASKGPLVIGNIEDDYHALGRRLVVVFLRAAGWQVYDLGNDVLPTDFVDKAVETGAKIIGASAMMHTTALNIKTLRQEIDRRGLSGKIQLAVGGAVFIQYPELVKEVGGDGTAKNAVTAVSLMEDLWARAEGGK